MCILLPYEVTSPDWQPTSYIAILEGHMEVSQTAEHTHLLLHRAVVRDPEKAKEQSLSALLADAKTR